MTKQEFTNDVSNSALAEAVIAAEGWASFKESAQDVSNHGIDGGSFGSFIYHSDTCDFAKKNRELIKAQLKEESEEFGTGMLEMVQGFQCLGADYSLEEIGECLYGEGDNTQILNALAWYAAETVARWYSDKLEG